MEKVLKNIFDKAIEFFGFDAQCGQFAEEVGELLAALNQYRRGRIPLANLTEEIADVQIMLEQIKIMFNIKENDVQKFIDLKLDKLSKKMSEKV